MMTRRCSGHAMSRLGLARSSLVLTPPRVADSAISALCLLELRPVVLRRRASTSRNLLAIRAHPKRTLGLLVPRPRDGDRDTRLRDLRRVARAGAGSPGAGGG